MKGRKGKHCSVPERMYMVSTTADQNRAKFAPWISDMIKISPNEMFSPQATGMSA